MDPNLRVDPRPCHSFCNLFIELFFPPSIPFPFILIIFSHLQRIYHVNLAKKCFGRNASLFVSLISCLTCAHSSSPRTGESYTVIAFTAGEGFQETNTNEHNEVREKAVTKALSCNTSKTFSHSTTFSLSS